MFIQRGRVGTYTNDRLKFSQLCLDLQFTPMYHAILYRTLTIRLQRFEYFLFLLSPPSSHENDWELSRASTLFCGLLDVKLSVSIHGSQVTSSESELFSISPIYGSAVQPVWDEQKNRTVSSSQWRVNCTDLEIKVSGRTMIHLWVMLHADCTVRLWFVCDIPFSLWCGCIQYAGHASVQ